MTIDVQWTSFLFFIVTLLFCMCMRHPRMGTSRQGQCPYRNPGTLRISTWLRDYRRLRRNSLPRRWRRYLFARVTCALARPNSHTVFAGVTVAVPLILSLLHVPSEPVAAVPVLRSPPKYRPRPPGSCHHRERSSRKSNRDFRR